MAAKSIFRLAKCPRWCRTRSRHDLESCQSGCLLAALPGAGGREQRLTSPRPASRSSPRPTKPGTASGLRRGGGTLPAGQHQRARLLHQFLLAGRGAVSSHAPTAAACPPQRTNTLAADAAMDAALAALETAVKLDERHAESHALLGTLYGMKINGNLLRAARFGPRVREASEEGAGVRRAESARALSARHLPVSHRQETGGAARGAGHLAGGGEAVRRGGASARPGRSNRAGAAAVASPSSGGPTNCSASARRRRITSARRWPNIRRITWRRKAWRGSRKRNEAQHEQKESHRHRRGTGRLVRRHLAGAGRLRRRRSTRRTPRSAASSTC